MLVLQVYDGEKIQIGDATIIVNRNGTTNKFTMKITAPISMQVIRERAKDKTVREIRKVSV